MIAWTACRLCGYPADKRRGVHSECEDREMDRLHRVNKFILSYGYSPLVAGNKKFSASWYLNAVHLAKIKLSVTAKLFSKVPTEDTDLFSTYSFILSRQCARYQFVLRRAYAAFCREAFNEKMV